MEKDKLRELLLRYAKGDCTKAERKVLEDMILRRPLASDWEWGNKEEKVLMGEVIKQRVDKARFSKKWLPSNKHWQIGIAASLLLLVGVALFFQQESGIKSTNKLIINETVQSAEGITLTLADGTVVELDGHAQGFISNGKGVAIKKVGENQVVYESPSSSAMGNDETKTVAMNTIRIPNGKQFQLTLPDGTEVWLNTASTLTYPVVFGKNEREVILEGEAYFEVAKDKSRPFSVWAHDTRIAVTGTHFNVSAYSTDKSVMTTLLEGGVNIMKNNSSYKLNPGYQAITYYEHDEITHHRANVDNVLAWRNGYFVFDGQDIVSIMRSVARWYDIQVVFDEDIPHTKFGGTFPISAELDELLADLGTLGNIHFVRKGKEVKIMP